MRNIQLLLFICLIGTSCATMYKPATSNSFGFQSVNQDSAGIFIYSSADKYINPTDNKRLSAMADKNDVYFLPLKVINLTDTAFTLTAKNIEIFNNFEPAPILNFNDYSPKVRYKTYANLFWFVGGLLSCVSISNNGAEFTYKSPGLALLIPGTINILKAGKANKLLKENFIANDLLGATIDAKSEKIGFICVRTTNSGEFLIRLSRKLQN